jgi:SAM-dependent methyltransferase
MDRFDLYEMCVQDVERLGPMLMALHAGGAPSGSGLARQGLVLHEDFAGSAALSRWWAARGPGWLAMATELDGPTLEEARARLDRQRASPDLAARVEVRHGDALELDPRACGPADVVFAGNFSIGYLGTRDKLMAYLRGAQERLRPGGILAVDLYGGASAYALGGTVRRIEMGDGRAVSVLWRHDAADARTARVVNSLSFRVLDRGEVTHELPEAFVYRWRLWGLAELREAMGEAGFASTRVVAGLDCPREPLPAGCAETGDDELGADWVALVIARR